MTMSNAVVLKEEAHQRASEQDPKAEEVMRLASTIDYYSPLTIQEFGSEVAESAARYTDEILQKARTVSLDETGAQLNEIVLTAQQFDLDSLEHKYANAPVVGSLLKRFAHSKEKAIARFASVKDQVEKLVSNVETTSDLLTRRGQDFQNMYDGIRNEYGLLGQHIEAIELRLDELNSEMAQVGESGDDLETGEKLAMLEAAQNQLSKRCDDLKVLQHSTMQMLPMIRIIQSNNLTLVDKFQTIRQLTLPAWKRTFMLLLTLDEQKSAVELGNAIDDATNMMMRRSAELLHQNSVATARANQRLVLDVETLREVHDKILSTLSDVRDEHQKGAAERSKAISELERLRSALSDGVKAIEFSNG